MEPKLCECGCGQTTQKARFNNYVRGEFKGEYRHFIKGHQNRGRKQSDASKRAKSQALLGHPVSEETRHRISEHHKQAGIKPSKEAIEKSNRNRAIKENSPSWKGGFSFTNGYHCSYNPDHPKAHPNGYVYTHILVAEHIIGRGLISEEVVHHIDGNKLNNDPDNLLILASQAEHINLHRKQGDID